MTPIKVKSPFAGLTYPSPSSRAREVRLTVGSIVVWMGSFVSDLGVECQIVLDPERGCVHVPGVKMAEIGEIL